jgi:hypothetical protein
LQRDDVEEDHEPDGQIAMAGLRQELRGYADAIAAERAVQQTLARLNGEETFRYAAVQCDLASRSDEALR